VAVAVIGFVGRRNAGLGPSEIGFVAVRPRVRRVIERFLFQGGYFNEFLLPSRSFPIREKFSLMKSRPFDHKAQCTRRQPPGKHEDIGDVNERQFPAVLCVEMGRIVIVEEHFDDDAEETTDFRHGPTHGQEPGIHLPAAFRSLSNKERRDKDRYDRPI